MMRKSVTKIAPKLRFPGFSGEWQLKRLGAFLTIKHGKSQHDVEVKSGGYPILASGGEIGRASRPLYSKPSVLIGRKGTIDQPRYIDTPFWTVDTLFYSELRDGNIAKFFYYLFCKVNWRQHNEGSGVPSLSASTISSIDVCAPSIDEQQKLADFLGAVDARITTGEKKLELLKKYKQGVMQKIFTQQIRFKDADGRQYSDWEKRELGSILDYEQPTRYIVESTEYDNKYPTPVLTAGKSLILGYTNETNGIYTDVPIVIFDDFTTSSQFVDFSFKVKSSAMKLLKAKKGVNIRVAYELLKRIKFAAEEHKRHWIGEFQEFVVLLPSEEEQQKIADSLTVLDDRIKLEESKLEGARNFKKSLLQQMFV